MSKINDSLKVNETIPVEDHSPRFDIGSDALSKANQKILEMSLEKRKEAGDNVTVKNDTLIYKRTTQDYINIWNAFLESEQYDFKDNFKYGVDEILKIGTPEKFIDFMDWRIPEDVSKWRTDALHVIPCCHCGNEFSVMEYLALCTTCKPLYDEHLFYSTSSQAEQKVPGSAYAMLIEFVFVPNKRAVFLKENRNILNAIVTVSEESDK